MIGETKKSKIKAWADRLEARIFTGLGVVVIIAGVLVLGFQCIYWLAEAVWIPLAPNTFFGESSLNWKGVEKIILWIFDLPLSLVLIAIGWMVIIGASEND